MTLLESIHASLRSGALYNMHEVAAPRVILWPDEERLWERCIETLRAGRLDLWTLGAYAPEKASGPAAWLRYQLELSRGAGPPVIYLPGVGRSAFRSADQMPSQAKHLFALQFEGQFWTQKNGRDWTPYAYLSSSDGGTSLDVAGDLETKKAIQESLQSLLHVELAELRHKRLDASVFRAVVTKDPVRTLLRWMSDPAKLQAELEGSGSEWVSFCAVCRDEYGFDPISDGALVAAEKLAHQKGGWPNVWQRFREKPSGYIGVKSLLESTNPVDLLGDRECFPHLNRDEEARLEKSLLALSSLPPKEAVKSVLDLSAEHAHRADWVWAELGEGMLAEAICHLGDLASVVKQSGNPSTWEELAEFQSTTGWKADFSVLQALNAARPDSATKAVTAAVRAVYLPWIEWLATLTQSLSSSYPNTGPNRCRTLPVEEGTVILFADGLRLDLAKALEERLGKSNHAVEVKVDCDWSALPTVTATAKPAWMPLAGLLGGPLEGSKFQSKEQGNGRSIDHARFKQLLTQVGITYVDADELVLPPACSWVEVGSVDTFGHAQGAKLAWRIDEELRSLQQRIEGLIQAGWTKVRVITDHGWVMMPGGLPKSELPKHLTASRWSRCARLEPGAKPNYPETSWFWDSAEGVLLAPGVSCFTAGMEYAHGGLTLQEALIPTLTVTSKQTVGGKAVLLKELKWSGMRLNAVFEGAQDLTVDVRTKVSDAVTSLATSPATGAADGKKTSLLIADDGAIGTAAFLVVVDQTGQAIFKHGVTVGED